MKVDTPAKGKITGYFDSAPVDFKMLVGPPPSVGSKQDEVDIAKFRLWQLKEDSPRWEQAKADAAADPSRFSEAFGIEISEKNTPILSHLLARASVDIETTVNDAKAFFGRPRPFQRFQLEHVCGMASAPAPDLNVKKGTSYPSGSGGFGWMTAFLLSEVDPAHAQALLSRAKEYAESRMVCGAHFPTDLAASQALASALIGKLHSNGQFQQDVACAQEEHAVMVHSKEKLNADCAMMKEKLTKQD